MPAELCAGGAGSAHALAFRRPLWPPLAGARRSPSPTRRRSRARAACCARCPRCATAPTSAPASACTSAPPPPPPARRSSNNRRSQALNQGSMRWRPSWTRGSWRRSGRGCSSGTVASRAHEHGPKLHQHHPSAHACPVVTITTTPAGAPLLPQVLHAAGDCQPARPTGELWLPARHVAAAALPAAGQLAARRRGGRPPGAAAAAARVRRACAAAHLVMMMWMWGNLGAWACKAACLPTSLPLWHLCTSLHL